MPLYDDYKAEELITDVGGNAEGPETVLTVDEYLMPQKWTDEEKKPDEVLCFNNFDNFLLVCCSSWALITAMKIGKDKGSLTFNTGLCVVLHMMLL